MTAAGVYAINTDKSAVVASGAVAGRWFASRLPHLGVPYRPAVKDLGVVHGQRAAERGLAACRWKDAVARLRRIALLPVLLRQRGWFIAAGALSAGAFGCAARLPSEALLQGMRSWVKHAVHKGSGLCPHQCLFPCFRSHLAR